MIAAIEAAQSKPSLCDLTGDRIACAILRKWARQPWETVHPLVLADRMEELGCSVWSVQIIRAYGADHLTAIGWRGMIYGRSRRAVQRRLLAWREALIANFGDFESVK